MYTLLKQRWFMLLMIFIMSWAGFANAFTVQVHQQLKENTSAQHHQSVPVVSQIRHVSHHHVSDCHQDNGMTVTTHQHAKFADNDCQQLQSISQQSKCQDCHTFYCQMTSSGLMPVVPELLVYMDEFNSKSQLTVYDSQHLSGYWQRILRPPKA